MLQGTRSRNCRAAVGNVGLAAVVAWIGQRRRVEKVEDVGPELEKLLTEGLEVLEDRHVDPLVSRTQDRVAPAAQVVDGSRGRGDIVRRWLGDVWIRRARRKIVIGLIGKVVRIPWILKRARVKPSRAVFRLAWATDALSKRLIGRFERSAGGKGIADLEGADVAVAAGSRHPRRRRRKPVSRLRHKGGVGGPATDYVIHRTRMIQELASRAEWHIVEGVEGETLAGVITGVGVVHADRNQIALPVSQIAGDSQRRRRIIQSMRPGICGKQTVAVRKPLLQLGLQAVVVAHAVIGGIGRAAKVRERTCILRTVAGILQSQSIVWIGEDLKVTRGIPDIADCGNEIVSDATLDVEIPAHRIRSSGRWVGTAQRQILDV